MGATGKFRNQEVCLIGMSYKTCPSSFSRWHLNLWASFYLSSTIFLFREFQLQRLQVFIWEAKIGGTQITVKLPLIDQNTRYTKPFTKES